MLSSKGITLTKSMSMALLLGLGLVVSGCQVRPLYSSQTASGQTLSAELATIDIASAKSRIEQEVRNHLVFAFTGGGEAATPVYRLTMALDAVTDDFDIEAGSGLSSTSRVTLKAKYSLKRISDGQEVTSGASFFTASFSKGTQRFANDRARRDAENRAAEQVANDIQLRLSAFLAAGT